MLSHASDVDLVARFFATVFSLRHIKVSKPKISNSTKSNVKPFASASTSSLPLLVHASEREDEEVGDERRCTSSKKEAEKVG